MPDCDFTTHALFILTATLLVCRVSLCEADHGPECDHRRIYVRRLPSRFNLDLLSNCSDYHTAGDFCPYLGNHGLGPLTHNGSKGWYRTDPLMLEPFFHRRIMEYSCLTDDPSAADAVFLPYYAGMDALRYLYGVDVNFSASHGLELHRYLTRELPEIWGRHNGHDHFLVMARPAWDFSQPVSNDPPIWGTSFLEIPEFFNLTALTLESRAWPWQEQAIPYPTSFHPSTLSHLEAWVSRARKSTRTTLAVFAGGGGVAASPNIRRSIRDECENRTYISRFEPFSSHCEIVDCSNGVCEHDPTLYMRPMLKSTFCLQPPGETPTRRSTFDGILAGCIPVFFENLSAKSQYTWHLPEDRFGEFSVFIEKEDVVFNGKKILETLMQIPRSEMLRMREKVLEILPRIMYRKHSSSPALRQKEDAVDIAVSRTLRRIRSKVSASV